jgi:guanylate cyclase soluble subunit beta
MYGMIHCAVREMVVSQLGLDEWSSLEREAEITVADQISLKVYDDALTMRIMEAASVRLDLTLPECLAAFGKHWIGFASNGSFKSIMDFTGDDIVTFVGNLDQMHRAVVRTLPSARMPSFRIVERGLESFKVQYRSDRVGLERFVAGLLEGLLEHFELTGDVTLIGGDSEGLEYLVNFRQR